MSLPDPPSTPPSGDSPWQPPPGPGWQQQPPPGPPSELARDAEWRRLDLRMLLVHPVNELVRFFPLLIALFLFGSSDDGGVWHYIGVAVPIAIGVVRFATTRFRITPGQIELRRGLLSQSTLTAPLDRVRTVELTASPIHRLLALEKVEIGTGSAGRGSDGRVVLDALGAAEARRLRHELLLRRPGQAESGAGAADPGTQATPAAFAPAPVLLRFDPAWARFAPLTGSGLLIALAGLAASGQFVGNEIAGAIADSGVDRRLASIPLLVLSRQQR